MERSYFSLRRFNDDMRQAVSGQDLNFAVMAVGSFEGTVEEVAFAASVFIKACPLRKRMNDCIIL